MGWWEIGSPQKLLQQGGHVCDLSPLKGEAATAEPSLCLLDDGVDPRGRAGDPEKAFLVEAVLFKECQHLRWSAGREEGHSERRQEGGMEGGRPD